MTMKRMSYASLSFRTDARIADAVLSYAGVLAIVDSSDVVALPGIDDDGTVRRVQMLIGPSSQIMTIETDDDIHIPDVAATVAEFDERAQERLPTSLGVVRAGLDPDDPDATALDDPSS